jgi:hypothetical protein
MMLLIRIMFFLLTSASVVRAESRPSHYFAEVAVEIWHMEDQKCRSDHPPKNDAACAARERQEARLRELG